VSLAIVDIWKDIGDLDPHSSMSLRQRQKVNVHNASITPRNSRSLKLEIPIWNLKPDISTAKEY
jgi:hypothetical protein